MNLVVFKTYPTVNAVYKGRGPGIQGKIVEITSGTSIFQQGLVTTCKDLGNK